ncbi:uncharacterized protein LOC118496772 isoform X1 [Phyllostomus discolor]|uniref:Uncharacterized protein LOC118496772 isoform X1 n=1 Tax=Phyllostomus discolor TaxID=89673 RepID=A0A7E6CEF6_9CHIR|nr:uncharacterized protein LOC118496772 isoform X1 [Phyllostomus discolor]
MTLPGPRAASQRRNIPQPGPSIPTPRRPLPYRSPRPPRALACSLPQVFPGEKENTKSSNLRLKTCRAPASAPESSRALANLARPTLSTRLGAAAPILCSPGARGEGEDRSFDIGEIRPSLLSFHSLQSHTNPRAPPSRTSPPPTCRTP